MKEQFVPYELSLQLKKLGFDEPCLGYYYADKSFIFDSENLDSYKYKLFAPLWQQAFNWFKEKYKLYVTTTPIIWSYDTMELAFKLHIAHIKESNEIVCSETYLEEDLQLYILKQLIRCKKNLNL